MTAQPNRSSHSDDSGPIVPLVAIIVLLGLVAVAIFPLKRLYKLHDLAKKANRPIEFFGAVLDQSNRPIADVKVTLHILKTEERIPGWVNDKFDTRSLTTDSAGRFALIGAKGALLGIDALEKRGYEPSAKSLQKSYWYWRDPSQVFHPDPKRPEIFRMWHKAGAERLVQTERRTRIAYDGTPVTFDLLQGLTVTNGGDLRVTLFRDPQQITPGQRNYYWRASIEAVDGGVIASDDEQMFLAPADGYQPKIVFEMPSDALDWTDTKSLALYIKSRNGTNYGRVQVEFRVWSERETTGFGYHSFVNPRGSRNLEFDPRQYLLKADEPMPR